MQNPEQTQHGREVSAVTHPSKTEWVSYLYGELPSPSKATLRAHLKTCAACRDTLSTWQTARSELGRWQLEAPAVPRPMAPAAFPWLKWAMAAVVVLGLGYLSGRVSAGRMDSRTRASLAAAVRQEVEDAVRADFQAALSGAPEIMNTDFRRRLRADLDDWSTRSTANSKAETQRLLLRFAETYNANRQRDQQAVLTWFDRAEQKHDAEYISLRRAVETVAVVADDKFQRTETQLGELASYAEARLISDKSDRPFNR
jgi:hypothetical protein